MPDVLAQPDQAAHEVQVALLEGAGHAPKVSSWANSSCYEILLLYINIL